MESDSEWLELEWDSYLHDRDYDLDSDTLERLFALARRGAAADAGWKWMQEQAAKCVEDNAAVLDHPSVYMGGPSRMAKMKAGFFAEAIRALPPPPEQENAR